MAYPIVKVTLPGDLVSAANGRLTDDQLVVVAFPGRGNGRLHYQAARSWYALANAVLSIFGEVLTVTSWPDAYRDYARQLSAFLSRMEPVSYAAYLITVPSKRRKFAYGGHTYWRLKPGMAAVATPGFSNHGWGLALDVCVLRADGSIQALILSKCWTWLLEHADEYGLSWELQTESWHLRLFTGDATPQAILEFESDDPTSPLPPFDPAHGLWGLWPLAINKPRLGVGSKGDAVSYLQGVIFHKAGGNITIDGSYGPKTKARVEDMQGFFGLTVDGWVGPQTWGTVDFLAVM
jgi:hypothetical protein